MSQLGATKDRLNSLKNDLVHGMLQSEQGLPEGAQRAAIMRTSRSVAKLRSILLRGVVAGSAKYFRMATVADCKSSSKLRSIAKRGLA
mmetsp:Transcript_16918/g.28023  ORF Transcript_16918/g.28023 Transcript_16918/m.28023 type:complete len:88 (+) Transcript_16918:3-266(+)